MIHHFSDWVRVIQGLVGVLIFALLLVRVLFLWKRFSAGEKMIFATLSCWTLAVVYRSIELTILDAPLSFATVLFFAGELFMMVYLLEPKKSYGTRLGKDPRNR